MTSPVYYAIKRVENRRCRKPAGKAPATITFNIEAVSLRETELCATAYRVIAFNGAVKNMNDNFYSKEQIRQKYNTSAHKYAFQEPVQELFFGLRKLRRRHLQRAYGNVLEIAVGTGVNLPYYPKNCNITAIDYSQSMLNIAQQRAHKLGIKVRFMVMDSESLDFPNQSFDTIVSTLSICTFPNPIIVLNEIARVCRKGGIILLLEHGRSSNKWLQLYQDRTAERHSKQFGCIWNREPLDIVKQAGLKIVSHDRNFFGIFHLIEALPDT